MSRPASIVFGGRASSLDSRRAERGAVPMFCGRLVIAGRSFTNTSARFRCNHRLVMLRGLVESRQQLTRGWRDDRDLMICAGECPNCVHRLPERDRHKLDTILYIPSQQISAVVPGDAVDAG